MGRKLYGDKGHLTSHLFIYLFIYLFVYLFIYLLQKPVVGGGGVG